MREEVSRAAEDRKSHGARESGGWMVRRRFCARRASIDLRANSCDVVCARRLRYERVPGRPGAISPVPADLRWTVFVSPGPPPSGRDHSGARLYKTDDDPKIIVRVFICAPARRASGAITCDDV